jgi:hypothetical protein
MTAQLEAKLYNIWFYKSLDAAGQFVTAAQRIAYDLQLPTARIVKTYDARVACLIDG